MEGCLSGWIRVTKMVGTCMLTDTDFSSGPVRGDPSETLWCWQSFSLFAIQSRDCKWLSYSVLTVWSLTDHQTDKEDFIVEISW